MATNNEVRTAISDYLRSKNLPPTATWLNNYFSSMTNNRPNTPILAQQKTALFRILSADLTTSVQPNQSGLLPTDVSGPETKERVILGSISVQVLDIEDIGHSRWSQVETLEAQDRGEMTKGREIIRVVDDEDSHDPDARTRTQQRTAMSATGGPHKLLLQDSQGTKIYAFEVTSVNGIGVQQMSIGAKLVLRNVVVARGMALLEPKSVEVLGGKVEVWDKKWRAERKEVLKRKAGLGLEGEGEGSG